MLVGQREKSRKYFDLSTFNYNLTDSNPCSSLGVMNFQKWELFSGSPGSKYEIFIWPRLIPIESSFISLNPLSIKLAHIGAAHNVPCLTFSPI